MYYAYTERKLFSVDANLCQDHWQDHHQSRLIFASNVGGASSELVGDGFFFFFFRFSYFKIVMILLMLNVNADECVLISDVVPPPRMPCQFVKVWL
jgi:hypothetical protein